MAQGVHKEWSLNFLFVIFFLAPNLVSSYTGLLMKEKCLLMPENVHCDVTSGCKMPHSACSTWRIKWIEAKPSLSINNQHLHMSLELFKDIFARYYWKGIGRLSPFWNFGAHGVWCPWYGWGYVSPTLTTYPETTPITNFGNFGPIWMKLGGEV